MEDLRTRLHHRGFKRQRSLKQDIEYNKVASALESAWAPTFRSTSPTCLS